MTTSAEASGRRLALVDVNNFYCSAELVFNPALARKPMVVASNNDGCVVSRTAEAKALGVKMAEPVFEALRRHPDLVVQSSNYALYAEMSSRTMTLLADMAPALEVYSIDEAFLDLTGLAEVEKHARAVRQRVAQWLGLPVCVGIGSTKTRAKVANGLAKKRAEFDGVLDLEAVGGPGQERLFRSLEVSATWGIGRRLSERLKPLGIHTVWDLHCADAAQLRRDFGVVVERTSRELQGVPCLDLAEVTPPRKQIMSSRSFSREVTAFADLREAVLGYLDTAVGKLREEGSVTQALVVFLHTNAFKEDAQQYHRAITIPLAQATDDRLQLARAALEGLRGIYRPRLRYKKAGVLLTDLTPRSTRQASLFDDPSTQEQSDRLNSAIDQIRARFGREAVGIAASVRTAPQPWEMRRGNLSPAYTTNWDELPQVR